MTGEALITLKGVRKRYGGAEGRVALDGVDLTIHRGELVAILGTSGSGKSTLLHVMGALDASYEGDVVLDGHALRALSDADTAALRQRLLGFVFQGFHLVPTWSVRQNVALPASFAPTAVPDLAKRVDAALERVGLGGRGDDLPATLSGGQRQRVAIARAILMRPAVLLCDEPTGSLDLETGAQVLALFSALHREDKTTMVIVTHESRATDIAERVVRLEQGKVVSDVAREASP